MSDDAGEMSNNNMNNYINQSNNVEDSHHNVQNSNRCNDYLQGYQQGNYDCSHLSKIYDCMGSSSASFNNNNTSNNNFDDSGIKSNNNHQEGMRSCSNSKCRQIDMSNIYERILPDSNIILTEILPAGWIMLEDVDSGEAYYANEATGESTWDKPTIQQTVIEEKNFDDNHPPDWIALEDADSGETYYLNQLTMATTWDRPTAGNGSETEVNDGEQQSSENSGLSDHNGDLPPGWEAIFDPSSGDNYFAHVSGETQWEPPEFDQAEHDVAVDGSGEQGRSGGNDSFELSLDEILPPGWFAAIDEDSGDHYYCNEVTGETTWDIPTDSAIANEKLNNSNQAPVVEVDEKYHGIPPGWFATTDPDRAELYFCNEETGETTWDRPTSMLGAAYEDAYEQNLMSRLTINDNTGKSPRSRDAALVCELKLLAHLKLLCNYFSV